MRDEFGAIMDIERHVLRTKTLVLLCLMLMVLTLGLLTVQHIQTQSALGTLRGQLLCTQMYAPVPAVVNGKATPALVSGCLLKKGTAI